MIDFIFAAEFDIFQGSCIKGQYPSTDFQFNESLLASYMIPDGVHKRNSDQNCFKFEIQNYQSKLYQLQKEINQQQIKAQIFRFDSSSEQWEQYFTNEFLQKQKNQENLQIFHQFDYVLQIHNYSEIIIKKDEKNNKSTIKRIKIFKDIQFTQLNEKFCSLYTQSGESIGFHFCKQGQAELLNQYFQEYEDQIQLKKSSFILQNQESLYDLETSNLKTFLNNKDLDNKTYVDNIIKENQKQVQCQFEKLKLQNHHNSVILKNNILNVFNIIRNKKDNTIKRGSLIRSICICSYELNHLYMFKNLIEFYINRYLEIPVQISEQSDKILSGILQNLFEKINTIIREISNNYFKVNKEFLVYIPFEFEENLIPLIKDIKLDSKTQIQLEFSKSYYKNYTNVSLLDFIKLFKEKTMIIYNAILEEKRILFNGFDSSSEDLCNIVNSCLFLVYPFNVQNKIYPYEHLQNLTFIENQSYIAGIANPIFKQHQQWWDYYCDIGNGAIQISNQQLMSPNQQTKKLDDISDLKLQNLDSDFIKKILKKIQENQITELEIRLYFYEYTFNWIQLLTNTNHQLDIENDDKALVDALSKKSNMFRNSCFSSDLYKHEEKFKQNMKVAFGENYLEFYMAMNVLQNNKILNDFELLTIYTHLVQNLKDTKHENLILILENLMRKKNNFQLLSTGMFSTNEEVVRKTLEFFEILEKYPEGQNLMKKYNYYVLLVFQNIKNKLQLNNCNDS